MNFDCTYARTSQEAIEAIRDDGPWDETWFDHDLGGDDTISPVVSWIMEAAFYGDPPPLGRCVIHTDNPVGRAMLKQQLSKHYDVVDVSAIDYLESILPH